MNDIDIKYLRNACYVAKDSPDDSVKNGAILTRKSVIVGTGYNHFPNNTQVILHPKDAKRERICHAEMAALADAARKGCPTNNTTLYCTWAMCANCAKHLIDFGVTRIVTLQKTYDLSGPSGWLESIDLGIRMCQEAGVEYELCSEVLNEKLFFRGEWILV